ncbi:MAG: hypothetical protein ABI661_00015 [Gammaproteobacteria bacterium]
MVTASVSLQDGVRIVRDAADPAELTLPFAASLLAEITHLPTGTGGGLSELVTLAPGGTKPGDGVNGSATLIRVLSGQIRLSWGGDPGDSTATNPGDTALLPAGSAYTARNESTSEGASFILVRGE